MGCLGTHWYFFLFSPLAARGGSFLTAEAFPVSRIVLELPVPIHRTQQKALHMSQVRILLFLVVRDTIGFEPISITLFELSTLNFRIQSLAQKSVLCKATKTAF